MFLAVYFKSLCLPYTARDEQASLPARSSQSSLGAGVGSGSQTPQVALQTVLQPYCQLQHPTKEMIWQYHVQ